MDEEGINNSLDILCIGEIKAGKSFFLKQYTQQDDREKLHASYDIYVKKVKQTLVYLHELSEEENLYLEKVYDGILFFVDFIDTWNAVENILKWLELHSKLTGSNIFKIPIRVIITKTVPHRNLHKWKKALESELSTLVARHQIIYLGNMAEAEETLEQYFELISAKKAEGIKCSNSNHIRLYGLSEIGRMFAINARLTFFRWAQVFEKHCKNRLGLDLSAKNK